MSSKLLTTFRQFREREEGAVAIIFAIFFIGMMLFAGLAIDVGRAVHASTRIASALDAAALAGAKGLRLQGLSASEAIELTKKMFEANIEGQDSATTRVNSVEVNVDVSKSKVEVKADAEIDMHLAQLAGMKTMRFEKTSEAIFEAKDIEVAVQLDVTGSMGGSKIADLKSATKTLVDVIIPDSNTGQKVRVAYAPYSSGVNAGPFAANVTDGASSSAGSSCVFERKLDGDQTSDILPVGTAALRAKNGLPSGANRDYCPGATVLPLTDDKSTLKSTVDGYSTGGFTAGHLGTAWAYYLLSPNWGSVWPGQSRPANYDDKGTMKFAVLMTDGEYNTFNAKASSTKSRDNAIATCAAMKSAGIIVYTVGFMLTQADAKAVMAACASGAGKAYLATNGAALKAAFKDIAEDIVTLRLTK